MRVAGVPLPGQGRPRDPAQDRSLPHVRRIGPTGTECLLAPSLSLAFRGCFPRLVLLSDGRMDWIVPNRIFPLPDRALFEGLWCQQAAPPARCQAAVPLSSRHSSLRGAPVRGFLCSRFGAGDSRSKSVKGVWNSAWE